LQDKNFEYALKSFLKEIEYDFMEVPLICLRHIVEHCRHCSECDKRLLEILLHGKIKEKVMSRIRESWCGVKLNE